MRRRNLLVLLVAFGLGVASGLEAAELPAELVIVQGNVRTLDPESTVVSALAIRDGRIVARGENEAVRPFLGSETRVIDAHGKTVVPGLIESHVHALRAARGEIDQAYVQLGSIAEIQDWVRARAKERKPGSWIEIPRADVTRITERRMPTRAELDAAACIARLQEMSLDENRDGAVGEGPDSLVWKEFAKGLGAAPFERW